ncbi:MAG TPA: SpoIIIAH-like family protein [Massilibacterium sp.]|nr:SpoIIIAH-like family protein [Massilibacterium sp.]
MLKKQTIWLLTMLSLMVILSAYYMLDPEREKENQAYIEALKEKGENIEENVQPEEAKNKEEGVEENKQEEPTIEAREEDMFQTLRLERDGHRSMMKEEYTQIIASNETPAEMKTDAYQKMEQLQEVTQKETMLESLIRSKGYEDALVRTEGEQVRIIVKSAQLTKKEANQLMMIAMDHLLRLQPVANVSQIPRQPICFYYFQS